MPVTGMSDRARANLRLLRDHHHGKGLALTQSWEDQTEERDVGTTAIEDVRVHFKGERASKPTMTATVLLGGMCSRRDIVRTFVRKLLAIAVWKFPSARLSTTSGDIF
jgi:hypothetical protein